MIIKGDAWLHQSRAREVDMDLKERVAPQARHEVSISVPLKPD
jgi:hypothetical protein